MSARFDEAPQPMTLTEFLDWERRQPQRWEFTEGEPRMMVGGSVRHTRICRALVQRLNSALEASGCEAFQEGVKVIAAEQCHYPDVTVTCTPQNDESDTLRDPVLIVEVLSPTTSRHDIGPKWANYQTLPSLRAYLLVAQDRIRVEAYIRQADHWLYQVMIRPDDVLSIPALDLTLAVAEVYRGTGIGKGE